MTQLIKSITAATAMLAFFGALTVVAVRTAKPHTGPIAGTVTPFQVVIPVHITSGHNVGSANGVSNGAQAFTVPAGQQLTIETVSGYRNDPPLAAGTFDDINTFVSTSVGGVRCSYAGPDVVRDDEVVAAVGQTGAMKIYADAGTAVIINGGRNSTNLTETINVVVSGYLTTL